jgi:hypothetical protein
LPPTPPTTTASRPKTTTAPTPAKNPRPTTSPPPAPAHDGPTEANDLQAPATSPTTYYFQYSTHDTGACAAEPATCSLQPLSPLSIGSGAADVEASQHIRGLAPSTTYHYRVVAANEALPESAPGVLTPFYGSDLTFITQPPGAPLTLPDHRAWELVSPADKHGARVEPGGQAALDGASFTFLTHEPTEPATAGNPPTGVQVLATRAAPGRWSDRDIALSHSAPTGGLVGEAPEYRFFTEDLGLAVAESLGPFSIPEGWHQNAQGEWQHALEASPVPTQRTPYLRHNLTCAAEPSTCYEPLLNEADVTSGLSYEGDPTASHGLANFAGATPDGTHLVIGSPVQLTTAAAPDGGLYDWSADGLPSERLALASVLPDGSAASGVGDSRPADGLLALSADGSRLVFAVDEHPANGQTTSQALYLRDLKSEETVRLDLGEGGLPVSNSLSLYQGASADALTIFFTNVKPLLSGSGSSSNSGLTVTGDLYACEIETGPLACRLVDLTPVPAAGQPGAHESAQVRRVLGVNSDGNYVYFIARGVLAPGATPGENIYLAHREAGHWTVNFIASAGIAHQGGEPGIYAHVSPNGQWLAFTTRTPLTGYDNRDLQTGQPDLEAYLYDAATETLTCASCDPTGARPTGPAEVPASPRSLFDTGRLFFESADALVPQDTNGELDVYESEPAGLGDCTSSSSTFNPATGACVGLISSGVAFGPSRFIDASASGADVFFTTQQRLIPEDVDTATDVYDAHECTAASPCAAPAPPEPPPCQTADACRPAAQPQPTISGEPPSAAFHGAGNVKEEPASKKHHKKKHHKAKKHRRRASHNRGGQK